MEVGGTLGSRGKFFCFLCKDHGKTTQADGYCKQCEDNICYNCFEKHKKWKVAKSHIFVDTENKSEDIGNGGDELETCAKHENEALKFYCSDHEFVGCGDCIVLGHKQCDVEYVVDKGRAFKDSQEFKDLEIGISKGINDSNLLKSSVKDNGIKVKEINAKFIKEVETFRDEVINNVKKRADDLIKEALGIKEEDSKQLESLDKECQAVSKDVQSIKEIVETLSDKPKKLFVTSIKHKKTLERLENQLGDMKERDRVEYYHFQRDGEFEKLVKCSFGSLHREQTSDNQPVKALQNLAVFDDGACSIEPMQTFYTGAETIFEDEPEQQHSHDVVLFAMKSWSEI